MGDQWWRERNKKRKIAKKKITLSHAFCTELTDRLCTKDTVVSDLIYLVKGIALF